ncbi:2-hydroxyacylsphingosine 1-beta-galactosyltransferase-like [Lineus longissimus]|uniref:2-hydroxyacylsphingosine 1-beta-galactosyltransferase-like n=1 Tax=Lineus longissimus TaxID=88925 RepID=UPI00315CF534
MKQLNILTILLLKTFCTIEGAKFLVLSMQFSERVSEFAAVSEGLLDNGHEVHMVVDENLLQNFQQRLAGTKVRFLTYKSPNKEFVSEKTADEKLGNLGLSGARFKEILERFLEVRITYDCKLTLQDQNVFKKIQAMKFDMAIVDGLYFCYHIIPHKLGIPYVSLSSHEYPLLVRVQPLVGSMGCNIAGTRNTIFNRMKQFFTVLLITDKLHTSFCDEAQFPANIYSPEKPYDSLRELAAKTKLWLISQDNAIDCPRPTNPNIVLVGGITAQPAKPVTGEIARIVNNAKDGFILVSFGSMISSMPLEMQERFVNAFGQLRQIVIWKTQNVKVVLPKNVRALEEIPQNDLLGHKNLKLFITYCGNNANSEAVYHGVPMVAMPIFGDQFNNADRVEVLGHGRQLSITKFTGDQLYETMENILNTPGYTAKVKKASEILKDKPRHPRQEAAYWIEHVLRHGNHHLRTTLSDMNLAQYLMIDIYVLLSILILVLLLIVNRTALFIARTFCRGAGSGQDEKKKKRQ